MAKDVTSGLTNGDYPPTPDNEPSRCKGRFWRIAQLLALATSLWWLWFWITPNLLLRQSTVLPSDRVPDIGLPERLLRKWAQYAPYIPVAKYIPPPPTCTITQVSTLLISLEVPLNYNPSGTRGAWGPPFPDNLGTDGQ